jgi:hypothetical protein
MYGKRKFSDLLDSRFLRSMGVKEDYSFVERLAKRFGLGMSEGVDFKFI